MRTTNHASKTQVLVGWAWWTAAAVWVAGWVWLAGVNPPGRIADWGAWGLATAVLPVGVALVRTELWPGKWWVWYWVVHHPGCAGGVWGVLLGVYNTVDLCEAVVTSTPPVVVNMGHAPALPLVQPPTRTAWAGPPAYPFGDRTRSAVWANGRVWVEHYPRGRLLPTTWAHNLQTASGNTTDAPHGAFLFFRDPTPLNALPAWSPPLGMANTVGSAFRKVAAAAAVRADLAAAAEWTPTGNPVADYVGWVRTNCTLWRYHTVQPQLRLTPDEHRVLTEAVATARVEFDRHVELRRGLYTNRAATPRLLGWGVPLPEVYNTLPAPVGTRSPRAIPLVLPYNPADPAVPLAVLDRVGYTIHTGAFGRVSPWVKATVAAARDATLGGDAAGCWAREVCRDHPNGFHPVTNPRGWFPSVAELFGRVRATSAPHFPERTVVNPAWPQATAPISRVPGRSCPNLLSGGWWVNPYQPRVWPGLPGVTPGPRPVGWTGTVEFTVQHASVVWGGKKQGPEC